MSPFSFSPLHRIFCSVQLGRPAKVSVKSESLVPEKLPTPPSPLFSFPFPSCSLRGFRDPGSELESESGILEFLKKFPTLCLVP